MSLALGLALALASAFALNWGWVVQHGAASQLPPDLNLIEEVAAAVVAHGRAADAQSIESTLRAYVEAPLKGPPVTVGWALIGSSFIRAGSITP